MTNAQKPGGQGQPEITACDDQRVKKTGARGARQARDERCPTQGIAGSFAADRDGYRSDYGADSYAKAGPREDRTVHGGQQGVVQQDVVSPDPDAPKARADAGAHGHAGSRGIVPGAGADKGPPDGG